MSVSWFGLYLKSLIHKIPDKTALQVRAVINNIPKVFKIAIVVSLGVSILT